jgi:RNA polymerase sigma-70 factor (ECF subfamily)
MPGQNRPLEEAESFAQLYARAHLIVFRFIYGLHGGPSQEVEDLTTETFMRAWKARKRFEGDQEAALSWLLQIARNLVIDTRRRKSVRGEEQYLEELSDYLQFAAPAPNPEEQSLKKEQFRILWEQIQALPPEQREMIVLRYILGWQVKRIAAHSGLLENTVSVTLRRILMRLRRNWPES